MTSVTLSDDDWLVLLVFMDRLAALAVDGNGEPDEPSLAALDRAREEIRAAVGL